MNAAQEQALAALTRAFAQAQKAGLVFLGMDDSLLAFDRAELLAAGYQEDPHAAMWALDQGELVDTHGTYLDSGAW